MLSQSDEQIPPPHYALYAKNAHERTICLLAHTTFPCLLTPLSRVLGVIIYELKHIILAHQFCSNSLSVFR